MTRGAARVHLPVSGEARSRKSGSARSAAAGKVGGAAEFLPDRHTLPRLADAARSCKGCALWERHADGFR